MYAWHFTEMPYPNHPDPDTVPSVRVSLPSKHFDPKLGAELYNRYLDEHLLADDLGLNIMLNEHHQTATCLDVAAPLSGAILARQTTKARICILGNPMANRADPIRVAEEMAMIDVISKGRLDAGFVRGVPYEVFAANTNPTQTLERLWEGIDLCVKAWTTHDGPFNFEGKYWHKRHVNVWPRPYQDPHPPVWITGSSDKENIREVARRGFTFAMFLQPHEKVKEMFDAYRESSIYDDPEETRRHIAYMPLVATGETEEEAEGFAKKIAWYLQAKTAPQFRNPPGYVPVAFNVQALKGKYSGRTDAVRAGGMDYLKEQGVMIYGTPDSVFEQIKTFYHNVGGFGQFLMMQQAGHLDHNETVKSMSLFAKEVYPRLREEFAFKIKGVAAE
ncbi:MAG: LLM class flavin-dependent oxidoreductase [Alphaproteobacteria bacterium]|jgi:alkanesulfonate monooxygenase SsuD/methylene tetrahydromethanopterin reductase-like flavin-dependent oxidoreductase (luciferase family)